MTPKARKGRYPKDAELLREIALLCVSGRVRSARAAAFQMVPDAKGDENNANFQRLYRAYLFDRSALEAEARRLLDRQPKLMRKSDRPHSFVREYQDMTRSEFNREVRRLLSIPTRGRHGNRRPSR